MTIVNVEVKMVKELYFVLIYTSLAVASISLTISRAKIFSPHREWIARRNIWVGDLISCPYCTSHWISFIVCLEFDSLVITNWVLIDYLIHAFSIISVSSIIMGLILKLLFEDSFKINELEFEVDELSESLNLARTSIINQSETINELKKK